MESFVLHLFCQRSQLQSQKICDLRDVPLNAKIVQVDGNRASYIQKSTYDPALWKRVLYSPERRRLDKWSPLLPGDWAHQKSTLLNFHEWMALMWRMHGDQLPPAPIVLIPLATMPPPIEDPYQYTVTEMKKLLSEYNDEDIETLCKGHDSYTQVIAFVGNEFKNAPAKLSDTLDAIHKVFETAATMKKDRASYKEQEAVQDEINRSIDEDNRRLTQEYQERLRVYQEIVKVVSEFFAEHCDMW